MKNSEEKAKRAGTAGTAKSKMNAAILESAQDLESLGVISKRTLRGYEKRRLLAGEAEQPTPAAKQEPAAKVTQMKTRPPLRRFTPAEVSQIRNKLRASQGYFAMRLHVSPTTVQQWESGSKTPSGMATTLLATVDKHGLEILP